MARPTTFRNLIGDVYELRRFDLGAASGVEVADNQILNVITMTEGEDLIAVGDAHRIWLCAPLEVMGD